MSNSFTKSLASTLALSALFILPQSARCANQVEQQLAKADELMAANKVQAAVDMLRELVRTNPDNAQAHMELGMALAKKDDYETALLEEKQVLKLDPKSFGARIILGQIYTNQNKLNEAINIFKEACELKPTSYGAQRDLGIAYLTANKFDESMAAFKKATELNPKKEEAHLKLATLLTLKGNFRDAIAEANEAVQLAGGDAQAHLALGNALLESGDETGSVDSFKNALKANKAHDTLTEANALSGLGWAIGSKDPGKFDMDEGILDQRKAIKIFPPFMPAYTRLAELLSKQDKNKEAEEVYQTALKMNPDDPLLGTAYGKFLDRTGRKNEARTAFQKVLDKSPKFKPASDALAALDQVKTK